MPAPFEYSAVLMSNSLRPGRLVCVSKMPAERTTAKRRPCSTMWTEMVTTLSGPDLDEGDRNEHVGYVHSRETKQVAS